MYLSFVHCLKEMETAPHKVTSGINNIKIDGIKNPKLGTHRSAKLAWVWDIVLKIQIRYATLLLRPTSTTNLWKIFPTSPLLNSTHLIYERTETEWATHQDHVSDGWGDKRDGRYRVYRVTTYSWCIWIIPWLETSHRIIIVIIGLLVAMNDLYRWWIRWNWLSPLLRPVHSQSPHHYYK